MTNQRPPLTHSERADLRQKAADAIPSDGFEWYGMEVVCDDTDAAYIAAISPDRLLALLDEVERLETTNDRLMVELSLLDRDDEVLKVQP